MFVAICTDWVEDYTAENVDIELRGTVSLVHQVRSTIFSTSYNRIEHIVRKLLSCGARFCRFRLEQSYNQWATTGHS